MKQTSEYIESYKDKNCFLKLSGYMGGCWYLSVSAPDIKCFSVGLGHKYLRNISLGDKVGYLTLASGVELPVTNTL